MSFCSLGCGSRREIVATIIALRPLSKMCAAMAHVRVDASHTTGRDADGDAG